MEGYRVETMERSEVDLAIEWAAREGWNPGLFDAENFYRTDPAGFFAGKLGGEIIAVGSAVRYGEGFGFCGFYIVAPEYRGKGYGLKLTEKRLAYLGERNVGIDGVLGMLDKYERLGYRIAHKNVRYRGKGSVGKEDRGSIAGLSSIDFKKLSDYDSRYFPARRERFLKRWVENSGGAALGYQKEGELLGYGVIRPCREGYKIGPLFAERPEVAEALLAALTPHASGSDYFLDIPEVNPSAKALVDKYRFDKVFETARMYLRGDPKLPLENIYGITTFELG